MEAPTFANLIRKVVTMSSAAEMLEDLYVKTIGDKIKLAEKEKKLANEMIQDFEGFRFRKSEGIYLSIPKPKQG